MRNQEIEKLLHDICNVPPCFDFLIFLNTCPINVHIYFIEGAIFRNFKKLKWSSSHITSISGWLSQTSIHFYNVCRKLSQIRSLKNVFRINFTPHDVHAWVILQKYWLKGKLSLHSRCQNYSSINPVHRNTHRYRWPWNNYEIIWNYYGEQK